MLVLTGEPAYKVPRKMFIHEDCPINGWFTTLCSSFWLGPAKNWHSLYPKMIKESRRHCTTLGKQDTRLRMSMSYLCMHDPRLSHHRREPWPATAFVIFVTKWDVQKETKCNILSWHNGCIDPVKRERIKELCQGRPCWWISERQTVNDMVMPCARYAHLSSWST